MSPDGTLAVDTQTAYALALYMDLLPGNLRAAAGARLAKKIQDNDGRMSTGFLGTRPLLPVLSATGQSDLAVRLLQSRKYPSWGYEVEQGATTVWERWNSYTKDKGFGGEQNAADELLRALLLRRGLRMDVLATGGHPDGRAGLQAYHHPAHAAVSGQQPGPKAD